MPDSHETLSNRFPRKTQFGSTCVKNFITQMLSVPPAPRKRNPIKPISGTEQKTTQTIDSGKTRVGMNALLHPPASPGALSLSLMLYQKHLILIPLDFFSIKSSSGQQFPRCDVTPSHTAFYPKRIHRRWRRRRMATLSLHTWQPRSSSRGCSAYLE